MDNRVDLCVHAYKDLSRARPPGIAVAAFPERADPRDAVLFHPRVLDKLRRGEPLLIGASSARRQRHIADFLAWALPQRASTNHRCRSSTCGAPSISAFGNSTQRARMA